jgi:hypothetical protein
MAIVINGTTGITGVPAIGSDAANTPVVLQDSGSNTNTCRAWVNFKGTGTVAIRASFNVSSITDNGTGNYTVNFTTAMPDDDYSVLATGSGESGTGRTTSLYIDEDTVVYSTSQVRIQSSWASATSANAYDALYACVTIFR